MEKSLLCYLSIIAMLLMLCSTFSGCIDNGEISEDLEDNDEPALEKDQPSILPDWEDGIYHDYYDTNDKLIDLNERFEDLSSVFSIGKSVKKRDILCIKITNGKNTCEKYSCLIDGCIHGSEWESGEACLYLAEYLLINFGTNDTVRNILNTTEVYIVPLVNPDGRQMDERWNDNGVDLNRNYDVDFGRLIGRSLPFGKLFNRIKLTHIRIPIIDVTLTNSGRKPFSEPETSAIRDLMRALNFHRFSFYINCHTASHNIISPWIVPISPFEMTQREENVFDFVKNWVQENTEYEAHSGKRGSSGNAMDWCFKEFRIPSFIFEMLSKEYDPGYIQSENERLHKYLTHWMKTTLPVFLYFLVNVENFYNWNIPTIQPPLPEGVPPNPL